MSEANGGRLIDRIVAKSPSERRRLHVPEWEVDIYFPPLTKVQLEAATAKATNHSTATQSLMLLAHTAQDEAGQRLFRMEDIEILRQKADLNVLTRVEQFMWGTVIPSVEEAEADLKANPLSSS